MYAKGYYNGKRIKLISDEEAFQILKGESFNELYNEYSKKSKDEIEWYLFHQPNKFMLKKQADKMNIPWDKVPMNVVENF